MHYWLGKLKPLRKLLDSLDEVMSLKKKPCTKNEKPHSDKPPTYSDMEAALDNDNPDLVAAAKVIDDAKESAREAARALADAEKYLREVQKRRDDGKT